MSIVNSKYREIVNYNFSGVLVPCELILQFYYLVLIIIWSLLIFVVVVAKVNLFCHIRGTVNLSVVVVLSVCVFDDIKPWTRAVATCNDVYIGRTFPDQF